MTRETHGPSTPLPDRGRPDPRRLALPGLLLLGTALLAAYAFLSPLSSDEGWYLAGAHLASEGGIPYRDFAYSQGPVVPLVHGLALRLLGSRLLTQRLLGAFWGLLTLALLAASRRRQEDREMRAAIALLPAVASLGWHSQVALGNTFGLAGAFLAASGLVLLRGRSATAAPSALAVGLATAAAACRLTVAPFALVLLALSGTGKRRLLPSRPAALAAFATFGALLGPFLLLAPERSGFWLLGYHLGSSFERPRPQVLLEALTLFPALPLALCLGALALLRGAWREDRGAGALFVAAVAGIAGNLVLPSSYGGYVTPFVPLALSSSVLLAAASPGGRRAGTAAAALFAALGLAFPPPLDPEGLADLRRTVEVVRRSVPPGGFVVTSRPETAIEAGRRLWPGLEMGMFSMTNEVPPERAARLHLVTPARLRELLLDARTRAVVFSADPFWNLWRSVPSLRPLSPADARPIEQLLDSRWEAARTGSRYLVLRPRRPPGASPSEVPAPGSPLGKSPSP